ncbi:hypothetical protein ABWK96_004517 [Vibrio parahaemolyticus]|nr:hypothetical protein [Vibrio parahaemolyticus]KIT56350.1 hypothetical protein H334_17790 [Vibrio parahaemolyticus 901128]NTJ39417.1 hypothetical protein [Vibrio vulnificus]EGQ8033374.1 hypothetical protein [Vibrio parahaemolyticus]EGQ8261634.1 hypothetical protein [Vibrio parahaemolyticus]EGQ8798974.1 hypothetical protein [Vibrio parahaemolyticus]
MFWLGVVLAVIGLVFPVPLPFDDPVDFIGYLLIIVSMIKKKSDSMASDD